MAQGAAFRTISGVILPFRTHLFLSRPLFYRLPNAMRTHTVGLPYAASSRGRGEQHTIEYKPRQAHTQHAERGAQRSRAIRA